MNLKFKSRKYLELWQTFSKGSINRKIFAATLLVGFMTVFVKLAAVGKELIVAWRFGTGTELDAFVMAMVVPSFVINVVAGSFKSALIPVYIKVREQQGAKAAQRLFSGVMLWALILLAFTAILTAIAAPLYLPLLASGFNSDKLDLTNSLLWSLTPVILIFGIINIWGGLLNAGEKFALAAFSPVIGPVTIAASLLLFADWGIHTLVVGMVIGYLLELILLGIGLKRQKVELLPKWFKYDANLKEVANQYLPVVTGAFLMCSANLVDKSMAAMLDSGSVASLSYANRVISLPLTLSTLALGTAVVPYFSKSIAQKDWDKINHTFNYYLRLIFLTTIPLTMVFIVASKPIVRFLFERGSFTPEDTQIVSQILIFYALQIPFYISAIFVVRLVNSMGVNYFLAWGSSINLATNIVANYVFMNWIGIKGIALSTSLVYLISFVFLYTLTKKHLHKISTTQT